MTGDGDRLDGIVELLANSDFDRIGHVKNDDVRWLCRELRDALAEIERLKEETFPATWDGLIGFLDRQYPSDVFTGASADPGPQIVALTRELAAERAKVQRVLERCARADREQQPRPGVLGFVAPSVLTTADVRAALAGGEKE